MKAEPIDLPVLAYYPALQEFALRKIWRRRLRGWRMQRRRWGRLRQLWLRRRRSRGATPVEPVVAQATPVGEAAAEPKTVPARQVKKKVGANGK